MISRRGWPRNTAGLVASAARRASAAHARAEAAILALVGDGGGVSFNAVARKAEVSKTYLYSQSDLREQIGALRGQATARRQPDQAQPAQSVASLRAVIVAKDRRIKTLQARVRQLEAELEVTRGRYYAAL